MSTGNAYFGTQRDTAVAGEIPRGNTYFEGPMRRFCFGLRRDIVASGISTANAHFGLPMDIGASGIPRGNSHTRISRSSAYCGVRTSSIGRNFPLISIPPSPVFRSLPVDVIRPPVPFDRVELVKEEGAPRGVPHLDEVIYEFKDESFVWRVIGVASIVFPQFDPLHEDVLNVDAAKEALRVDERPVFVTLDVDLDDSSVKVRYLQEVVHEDRRSVGGAAGIPRRAEAVGVLRAQGDATLVVPGDRQLQGLAAVRDGVLDDDDLGGRNNRSGDDQTMNMHSDTKRETVEDSLASRLRRVTDTDILANTQHVYMNRYTCRSVHLQSMHDDTYMNQKFIHYMSTHTKRHTYAEIYKYIYRNTHTKKRTDTERSIETERTQSWQKRERERQSLWQRAYLRGRDAGTKN